MTTKSAPSRRSILGILAVSPLLGTATLTPEVASIDDRLLHLGWEFRELAAKIDCAIDQGAELCDEWLDGLSHLDAEIVATPATTILGLCVKARAACWARLGDLDTPNEATTDHRMALSIVRDLVRLYDPHLERPGGFAALVKEATS